MNSKQPSCSSDEGGSTLRELKAAREIAHAFLHAPRPAEVYRLALERVAPLVGASFGCVFLREDQDDQLLRVVARRLRRTNTMLADLIFVDVPGRVAKQLLQLAQRFGSVDGGQLRVTHDLTQEELAQLVGASRETVNKALADFAQRGWLRLEGKSVVILDRERLARRAR